ncbi:MAG: hypothetical protein EXQ67_08405 [Thermoleophilia bacterium]|nr:hypothetical protein [Thermoleophilia bacterium]
MAPGKTGSTAIKMALRRAGLQPVLQTHSLPIADARDRSHSPSASAAVWLRAHPPSAQQRWRVVTSVRDPVARAISRYFQDLRRSDVSKLSVADCLTGLSGRFIATMRRPGGLGWDWYGTELRMATGIDVYSSTFDHAVGHAELAGDNVRLFVVRQENLAASAGALGAFFGIDLSHGLSRENDHADTALRQVYQEVLDAFRPPIDYLDRVYLKRPWQHFYSELEIERLRAHWRRPHQP